MPSTNQLSRAVNVAQNYIRQAPLTGVGGVPNEPALTLGDEVRQQILSPPFAWRWNRQTTTITCVAGQQDYPENIANFGWIEKAVPVLSGTAFPELLIELNLGEETQQNQPNRIAARLDDDSGNINFRLSPAPDQAYVIAISYQLSSPSFTGLGDTWSPIPDYLWYLVMAGFKAKALTYMSDERGPFYEQMFLRMLVAASDGLSESEKNIFMTDRLNTAREAGASQSNSANARAYRSGQ